MFSSPISKKSNITEANKHLHMLYDRVAELETALQEQSSAFALKEEEMQEQLATFLSVKEAETAELARKLEASEDMVQHLYHKIQEKNSVIKELQRKADALDQICTFKPVLEKMLLTLTYGGQEEMQGSHNGSWLNKTKYAKRNGVAHGPENFHDESEPCLSLDWPKPEDDPQNSPILQMINHFQPSSRQFSISNEDGDTDEATDDTTPGNDINTNHREICATPSK